MASDSQYTFKGLHGIRDMALMLSLASDYLCEEVFLKKAGLTTDMHLKELKSDISSLKKRFPGKFVKEVDTDRALEEIHTIAGLLQKSDKEILKKCCAGELGLELEDSVSALANTVKATRMQVEGELKAYTKTESVLSHIGWIKSISHPIIGLSTLTVRLLGVVVLAAAMFFVYLFDHGVGKGSAERDRKR